MQIQHFLAVGVTNICLATEPGSSPGHARAKPGLGLVRTRAWPGPGQDLAGLTWVDGIGLIYRKMMGALESEGVQPIEALNQRFDPQLHEAVMSGPGEENVVVAELQRGYTPHGAVIRPAMVKVGNGENPAAGE